MSLFHTCIPYRISFNHYDRTIGIFNGNMCIEHFLRLKKRYIWVTSVKMQKSKDMIFGLEATVW